MKLVVGILFSMIMIVTSAFAADLTPAQKGQQIISDQISAFLEGDAARAFSHAAPQIQQKFTSPKKFIAMVKGGYQPLFLPHDFKFTKSKIIDDNLYQELIVTGKGGKRWRAGYALHRQKNGDWKITGVLLVALKGSSI